MHIKEITADALKQHVASLKDGYSLFEAEALQDYDYDRRAKSLTDELPEALSASQQLDNHTLINKNQPFVIFVSYWNITYKRLHNNKTPIKQWFTERSSAESEFILSLLIEGKHTPPLLHDVCCL